MKKILAALFLIAFASTASFAAEVAATATHGGASTEAGQSLFPLNAANQEGPSIGKLSNGVYFGWATLITSYVIKTQHSSGLRTFATASDSTAIVWKPATKGANIVAPAATATNSDLINEGGWSVM
jgi:hypothetical protein